MKGGNHSSSIFSGQSPFAPVLIFFISGILIRDYLLPDVPEMLCGMLFLVLLVLGIGLHASRGLGSLLKYGRAACLYGCFVLLGILLMCFHDIRSQPAWYGRHLQEASAFMVKTTGPVVPKKKTVFIPVSVKAKKPRDGAWVAASGTLNLYLFKEEARLNIPAGSVLIIPNRLQKIENSGNPFGFDYAAYLARRNIFHQAFLARSDVLMLPAAGSAAGSLQQLHRRLLSVIEDNVPDTVTRSLMEATLLNDRSLLRQDVWKAYSLTGIAHIISISGMHIGIFLGIVLFLLRWMPNPRFAGLKYCLAIPLVWFYIALTGFPPSAVRAGVMFTFLALSLLMGRPGNPINLLCATAFLLLVYNPGWLYDVGVQLSFLAVLSLLIFYRPVYRLLNFSPLIVRYLWSILAVSVAAQILVFPLVVYYFHQFPVWILFSSIPAALYSGLLMGGSLLLFFLDFISVPCLWLGTLLTWLTRGFHLLIFFLADHSPSLMRHLQLDALEFWILLAAVVGGAVFFLQRRTVFLYGAIFCLLFLVGDWILLDVRAAKREQLVVYHVSGKTVMDYFYGKSHASVHLETIPSRMKRYNLLPARLGYRAIAHNAGSARTTIWRIDGRLILFLEKDYSAIRPAAFPVDVLILNSRLSFRPSFWNAVFCPKLIVLDSSFPRWKAEKWSGRLHQEHFPVYDVGARGAWVFPR